MPRRLAVVGSGVAGLTAAYVASSDEAVSVTLYEADDRLGGHADTHDVAGPDGVLAIDTGFIVHNERTYPTLLRMFAELGVATQDTEMSMSTRDDATGLEWAGALGAAGLFPTWRNLGPAGVPADAHRDPALPPRRPAPPGRGRRRHHAAQPSSTTHGFTAYFARHFMEPVVAAVWSCDPAVALDYPARYLFSFLDHHGMLGVFGSPEWKTVVGGSRSYVDRVGARLDDVRLGTPVRSVLETAHGVEVVDANGHAETFDAVVIATHPDQALSLLADPTPTQREVLAALPYSANPALLHTDESLLPRARKARASWNFRRVADDRGRVTVTYDLTRLMRLPTETHYLVTLGGEDLVDPATVIARREYAHPLYTPESVAAQARLPECDTDRVAFAGAYHGWGFHEDGARSGLVGGRAAGVPLVATDRGCEAHFAREPRPPRRSRSARGARTAPATSLDNHRGNGARGLPDHHHPHPPQAVQADLHPPLAHLARRPRRPAGPRGAGAVRGERPPGLAARDAARQRHGVPRPARRRPDHGPR